MNGLGLCINVDSYVAHMFYAWTFSHNTAVTIAIKRTNIFFSLNKNTTLFDWVFFYSNKIELNN